MYRHILIPTDGSELSEGAVKHGVALAKSINARVTGLTVSTPFHLPSAAFPVGPLIPAITPKEYRDRIEAICSSYLFSVKNVAAAAGVTCDTVQVEHDQPYLAIIDTAARKQCDLIVMASHGRRGASAIVLGSEAVKVLTHSSIPVLVYRAPHPAELFAAT
ncbi:MAG: universal stress protein [Bradyrhizobiaceae bacterium]|nr:universal stress protein [Bradyrhizobiaceae bacterium]